MGKQSGNPYSQGALVAAGLQESDNVEIIADKETITLRKLSRPKSLDELFAGYHGDYQPAEFDAGADVGREVID